MYEEKRCTDGTDDHISVTGAGDVSSPFCPTLWWKVKLTDKPCGEALATIRHVGFADISFIYAFPPPQLKIKACWKRGRREELQKSHTHKKKKYTQEKASD